jgi:hypothetical protein
MDKDHKPNYSEDQRKLVNVEIFTRILLCIIPEVHYIFFSDKHDTTRVIRNLSSGEGSILTS